MKDWVRIYCWKAAAYKFTLAAVKKCNLPTFNQGFTVSLILLRGVKIALVTSSLMSFKGWIANGSWEDGSRRSTKEKINEP